MKDRISHLNSWWIGRECSVEKRLETNWENAPTTKNNHPTLKPISLNHKILSLFKTPDSQKILIPFAWSGSEIIWAIKAGFEDIEWAEINPQYVEIAEARIEYRSNKFKWEQTLFN
jgi:DNA modification methylase